MKMKKALQIALNVITGVLIAFILLIILATIISVFTVNKPDRTLFGHRMFIVLSDSMKDEFEAGDLIVCKVLGSYEGLDDGTIVTFISEDRDSFGETITHKIRTSTEYNGGAAYITYGTATGADDATPVPVENIIGVYGFHIPNVGSFLEFMHTTTGYVTIILVPFLILIGFNAFRVISAARAISAEKAAERAKAYSDAENEKLRAELDRLKASLPDYSAVNDSAEGSAVDEDVSYSPDEESRAVTDEGDAADGGSDGEN